MTTIVVDEVTKEWVVTELTIDEDQAVDWYEPYWAVEHDCE